VQKALTAPESNEGYGSNNQFSKQQKLGILQNTWLFCCLRLFGIKFPISPALAANLSSTTKKIPIDHDKLRANHQTRH